MLKRKAKIHQRSQLVRLFAFSVILILLSLVGFFYYNRKPLDVNLIDSVDLGGLRSEYSCDKFSFPNGRLVYAPGENIPIKYVDSSKPVSVEIYYSDLFGSVPDWSITNLMDWKKVQGKYDPKKGVFDGSINYTDRSSAELLIVANVKQDPKSLVCSGNPIFSHAPDGFLVDTAKTPCNGCQTLVAIDKLNTKSKQKSPQVDLKEYWNLQPGNNWTYSGFNTSYNPAKGFNTRIEVENPISICGFNSTPMRFTKDKIHGYWGPRYSWQPDDYAWNGSYSRRWFPTNFMEESSWNGSNFMGSLGAKSYLLRDGPNSIKELGAFFPANQVFFASEVSNHYYPPYFLSPRNLQLGSGELYSFDRVDKLFYPHRLGIASDDICNALPASISTGKVGSGAEKDHGWHLDIKEVDVVTPAYSGKSLRFRFVEFSHPMGSGFILREDWYFAKGVGLVKADAKDVSHYFTGKNSLDINKCLKTPMCLGEDIFGDVGQKNQPDATMQLINFYNAGAPFSVSSNKIGTTNWGPNLKLKKGDSWQLKINNSYTGWVDAYSSLDNKNWVVAEKWDWAEKGVITRQVPQNLKNGSYYAKFRVHTLKTPSKNEQQLNVVNLPWSNTLVNVIE